jgi:type III secretory pathway component EscS
MLTFGPGTQGSAVMSEVGWLDSLLRTLYGGLDPSIPGMGGRDCALHIPFRVKVFEAIAVIVYLGILYVWTAKTLTSVTEDDVRVMKERDQRLGGKMKKVVLMMLSLVFGMELSFKIITGRLLFVLNPCHAITLSQLYILCVEPNKWSVAVYRVMVHNLFGAFIGVLFAVTNTRELPGQVPVYWTQHFIICSVPLYIMYLWGLYHLIRKTHHFE